jgi:hypothetical protein
MSSQSYVMKDVIKLVTASVSLPVMKVSDCKINMVTKRSHHKAKTAKLILSRLLFFPSTCKA